MGWEPVPTEVAVDLSILSRLLQTCGTNDFESTMLDIANEIGGVEEMTGVLLSKDGEMKVLGSRGRRADAMARATRYAKQQRHRAEPLFELLSRCPAPGQYLTHSMGISQIKDPSHRWTYYEEPNFRSRFSVARGHLRGWSVVHFFVHEDRLSPDVARKLTEYATLIYPIIMKHLHWPDWDVPASQPTAYDSMIERLSARFPDLTERERSVCALTILGKSAKLIANELRVTPATVLTYRRRAYRRLGIHTANQLVGQLI